MGKAITSDIVTKNLSTTIDWSNTDPERERRLCGINIINYLRVWSCGQ